MSVPKQLLLSLLILAVAAAGWAFYQRPEAIFGPRAELVGPTTGRGAGPGFGTSGAPVVTAAVEIDGSGTEIRAIGTATAARSVVIYPQVTGIVSEVSFTPGSAVEQGQVLIRLEDADQQVAVELAMLAVETARQSVERAERLSQSGSVTAVTLADARTALQKAAIDLRSAEIELAKRTIRAPFDGIIGLADVSVGDLVTSSTAIATVADMSSVTVAFEVPERAVGQIRTGQTVRATAPAAPGDVIAGRLSAIDNRLDATTRTLRVEATLPNDAADLRPGMAVAIDFTIEGTPRPSVPSLAIQWDRGGSFVWRVDGDAVERVPVQVVSRRSGAVTVAAELAEGDHVVVEGVLRLRAGQKVRRVEEAEEDLVPTDDSDTRPLSESGAGSASAAERRG